MSKSKNRNLNGEQRRALLWSSIQSQTLSDLRDTLTTTAQEAHTRNATSGMTTLMEAAANGKTKSLDTLLDWYERRKVLRPKGWIDLGDDEGGRTALHLACAGGHLDCVESLLRYGANVHAKDDSGKTARDWAVERKKTTCVACIDEFLREPESEEEVVEADGSVLTSTQRSKLKKKEREQAEKKATTEAPAASKGPTTRVTEPAPVWDEVAKLCESFDQLRTLHDLTCLRAAKEIDPALFNLHWLKVLRLRLGPDFASLPGGELVKLQELQQLILSSNPGLSSLPSEICQISGLRVLEIEGCALQALPDGLAGLPGLESVNVANNALESLKGLSGCVFVASINASGNKLTSIDDVAWNLMGRLAELKVSKNRLTSLPPSLGACALLAVIEAESNLIKEVPAELAGLKKLRSLKLASNPIVDGKVTRMLAREGKGLKELQKYLGDRKAQVKGRKKGGEREDEEEDTKSDLDIDDDEL